MNSKLPLITLIIALITLAVVALRPLQAPLSHKETAYERVLRTMTLRCGYMDVPPIITVDPNTKAVGGMNYDYVEKMASTLGIKVTWQEVLIGQQVEALRAGRVDAVCGGEGPLVAHTSLYLHYSDPLAYVALRMYVRANDKRFDGTIENAYNKANDPSLKVAVMDGDLTQDFAVHLFPKTKLHELPQSTDLSQIFMDVADGKADFVISDPYTAGDFMKNNPGRLRQVILDKPISILPGQLSVLRGEEALADLLSQGVHLMRERGLDNEIFEKFEREYPGGLYRVGESYKLN